MTSIMTSLWRGWKSIAHGIIKGQNWLLMAIAYVVALGPVSIYIKLSKRKLDRGPADPTASTYGLPVAQQPMDVRRAQRQF